jgi:hypothetical protein
MPDRLDQRAALAAEYKNIAGVRLCCAPHNRSYVSRVIMWRQYWSWPRDWPCRPGREEMPRIIVLAQSDQAPAAKSPDQQRRPPGSGHG